MTPSETPTTRTWLVSVLFIDIVGYSKQPVDVQIILKDILNASITKAIGYMNVEERVILDTGDGDAICFLSEPEAALKAGLQIHGALSESNAAGNLPVIVRMGINLGPVKLVRDLNGQTNAVGDGINVGQRIMSFAADGQLTASRSFVEVVACLNSEIESRFQSLGGKKDKHGREHMVYLVRCDHAMVAAPATVAPAAAPLTASADLDPAFVQAVQQILAGVIGPIASVLTKRIAKSAPSAREFIDTLTQELDSPSERQQFVQRTKPLLDKLVATNTVEVSCVGESAPAPVCPIGLDGITLGDVERTLCSYLGPVGKVLVKKTSPTVKTARELYDALATHIPEHQDRSAFLEQCYGQSTDAVKR